MICRLAGFISVLLLGSCLASAQRTSAGRSQGVGHLPTPEEAVCEFIVNVVDSHGQPAGEQINVRVDSVAGGTVAEGFTNTEGKVAFAVRVGSYIVRVRGINIRDAASGTINIESFEKLHHEFVRIEPLDSATTPDSTTAPVTAVDLQVPEKARNEFSKAKELLAKGERDQAVQHLEKAIEIYPRFAMAYNNLAALYMRSKDLKKAREMLNKGLAADPELAWTHVNMARLDLMEGAYAHAIPLMQKALAKEPNNPEYLLLMCKVQFLAKNYDEVLVYAKRVYMTPHPNLELAHILAGRALEAQKKLAEAQSEYEALVKESPDAPEAAEARASIERLSKLAKK